MVGRIEYDLSTDDIVRAAMEIFEEEGLDAISMRRVATRLGVSPVPLYRRIGNKDALISATSQQLFTDAAPEREPGESWSTYALRWVEALRRVRRKAGDGRIMLRASYVEVSRPLIEAMRDDGFPADAAVQACRILVWATVGFAAVEAARPVIKGRPSTSRRSGSDPVEVTAAEADQLFSLHARFLIEGIERERQLDSG